MKLDFRDPNYRAELTFPGRPITRRVSPHDIERYLDASGYTSVLSAERGWPREIPFVWYPPRWPDPRALPMGIESRSVWGPRVCSHPLAEIVEAIAHNQRRTPGEVLREISVMAQMAEDGGG